MNKKELSATAALTAASVILETLPLKFPFPLLSYLTFDLGEIPIFFLLFYAGFYPSLMSSSALFITLLAMGQFAPIGPAFKFLALASALTGAYPLAKKKVALAFASSTALRIVVMTLANYFLIAFFMPDFLNYLIVPGFLNFLTPLDALLILTAIFNIFQNLISFGVALALYKRLKAIKL